MSNTLNSLEGGDVFSRSQNHWNPSFKKEQNLIQQYQKKLDERLSNPKSLTKVPRNDSFERIYRNSNYNAQKAHQSVFMSGSKARQGNHSLLLSRNLKSELNEEINNT